MSSAGIFGFVFRVPYVIIIHKLSTQCIRESRWRVSGGPVALVRDWRNGCCKLLCLASEIETEYSADDSNDRRTDSDGNVGTLADLAVLN